MDRRFLTVLGVSLVFALVVSSIFYQMTARSGSSTPSGDMKDVVVATRPLVVGVTIKPEDVKTVKMVAAAFPKGGFVKVEEVIDRPVVSNILVDEPVIDGRLAARGSGLGLAPTIPVGMRAATVRVNDVAAVAGFVLPGMRVDVLVTGRPPDGEGNMTNTCLQNMLVLSAGQTLQPDPRGQAIQAATVTLLATPEQAEILTLANNEGRLQLILRNSVDQDIAKTPGRHAAELYSGARPPRKINGSPTEDEVRPRPVIRAAAPPPPVVAAPPPPPPPDQVVMIRGTKKEVEVLPNRGN